MKKELGNPIGIIEIGNIIKEHEDGSATYQVNYDKTFEKHVKEQLNVKHLTKKQMSKYIVDMLTKAVNKEDGFKIEYLQNYEMSGEILK